DVAREELVRLTRIAREEPLQILDLEIANVSLHPVLQAAGGAHGTIPSARPTRANVSSANCSSSRVWVAVTIVRTRALPGGTVGAAIPCANTPAANSWSDNFIASAPSPRMTGVIGLSLDPASKPRAASPALKNFVLSQRRSMICGSSSS